MELLRDAVGDLRRKLIGGGLVFILGIVLSAFAAGGALFAVVMLYEMQLKNVMPLTETEAAILAFVLFALFALAAAGEILPRLVNLSKLQEAFRAYGMAQEQLARLSAMGPPLPPPRPVMPSPGSSKPAQYVGSAPFDMGARGDAEGAEPRPAAARSGGAEPLPASTASRLGAGAEPLPARTSSRPGAEPRPAATTTKPGSTAKPAAPTLPPNSLLAASAAPAAKAPEPVVAQTKTGSDSRSEADIAETDAATSSRYQDFLPALAEAVREMDRKPDDKLALLIVMFADGALTRIAGEDAISPACRSEMLKATVTRLKFDPILAGLVFDASAALAAHPKLSVAGACGNGALTEFTGKGMIEASFEKLMECHADTDLVALRAPEAVYIGLSPPAAGEVGAARDRALAQIVEFVSGWDLVASRNTDTEIALVLESNSDRRDFVNGLEALFTVIEGGMSQWFARAAVDTAPLLASEGAIISPIPEATVTAIRGSASVKLVQYIGNASADATTANSAIQILKDVAAEIF